jgi:hypothetical protein
MKRDKAIILSLGIAILMFFGYGLISEMSKDCRTLSDTECRLLWGTALLSIVGGGWLTVLLVRRRPAWLYETQESEEESSPQLGVWHRATLRVILSSLLTAAPLLVRGSFIAVVFGAGTGMMIVGFFGRLTGWILDEESS